LASWSWVVGPVTVTTIEQIRKAVADARRRGLSIGLVPTMGALHEGHGSLIRAAKNEAGFVVVSIFVNPTQFGPNEDFNRYPQQLDRDVAFCTQLGVDLIFHPSAAEMYHRGFCTYVEVHGLQDTLCGPARPGHFRGVATVVLKLFNIVQADRAYFGQKDAQQARIVEQMVRDLDVPLQIRVMPIVRAADGLALSSRNQYLDPEQRRQAAVLFQALEEARRLAASGISDTRTLLAAVEARIATASDARLEYAAIVDCDTLLPIDQVCGCALAGVAVHFGSTRLIDNVVLEAGAPN
jgi:pantoate--beta-alanine ligase